LTVSAGDGPPPAPVPPNPRRLVYFGTPAMAVPPLRALHEAGFDVAAVVTRIDKRRGRGSELTPSPVKAAAVELGIPVLHRVDDLLDPVTGVDADLGVVVAFGQIIRPHVLAVLPMVNLHFSLLPRWRGAAPVERAILEGDAETGVCLMQLEEGLDTGPVFASETVPIGPSTTGDGLREELVGIGSRLLVDRLRAGLRAPEPQSGEPTYAAKITADDLRLDWGRPATERDRQVRLGGAWTWFRGRRLKVVAAEVVDREAIGAELHGDVVGGLRLLVVQPEGRSAMPFAAFANGARPGDGERLGVAPDGSGR
jgi:methionyl-tRNA formyltransferase